MNHSGSGPSFRILGLPHERNFKMFRNSLRTGAFILNMEGVNIRQGELQPFVRCRKAVHPRVRLRALQGDIYPVTGYFVLHLCAFLRNGKRFRGTPSACNSRKAFSHRRRLPRPPSPTPPPPGMPAQPAVERLPAPRSDSDTLPCRPASRRASAAIAPFQARDADAPIPASGRDALHDTHVSAPTQSLGRSKTLPASNCPPSGPTSGRRPYRLTPGVPDWTGSVRETPRCESASAFPQQSASPAARHPLTDADIPVRTGDSPPVGLPTRTDDPDAPGSSPERSCPQRASERSARPVSATTSSSCAPSA